jgi:hypothetical protein
MPADRILSSSVQEGQRNCLAENRSSRREERQQISPCVCIVDGLSRSKDLFSQSQKVGVFNGIASGL